MKNCLGSFTSRDKNFVEIWRKLHDNNILAMVEEAVGDTSVDIDKQELTESAKNQSFLKCLSHGLLSVIIQKLVTNSRIVVI